MDAIKTAVAPLVKLLPKVHSSKPRRGGFLQAVALDLACGASWFFLANAHLARFFLDMADAEPLQQAAKAYRRALMDRVEEANNPDLHHNQALVRN